MAEVRGVSLGDRVVSAVAPTAATTNLTEGQAVKFSGSDEVSHPGDGAAVHGQVMDKIVNKDGALASVVMNGRLRFQYTGAAPVIGNSIVGSATAGKVKDAAATGPWIVVSVNASDTTVEVVK